MRPPLRVTVLGGGFGAAELLLALRSLAQERVALELVAAEDKLPFRIASTGAAFDDRPVPEYDLEALARDAGAKFRRDRAEAVAAKARRVRLRSGAVTEYDALVVAVGVRATVGVPGASTFRDQRDAGVVRQLITEMRAGAQQIVFAAPSGVAWTLPLYELSLLAAAQVRNERLDAEISVVTPERRPLALFGAGVSAHVEQLLERRGVRVLCGVPAERVGRSQLWFASGDRLPADRVVAVPRLVGRRLAGLPADHHGFLVTDARGRLPEHPDVFAIGDVTSFPVKQGGVATQQADVVAAGLATRAGAPARLPEQTIVLGSQLLGADEPLYIRAELSLDGRLRESTAAVSTEPPWWPAGKLFGRHLSPWLAQQELRAGASR